MGAGLERGVSPLYNFLGLLDVEPLTYVDYLVYWEEVVCSYVVWYDIGKGVLTGGVEGRK